MRPQRRAVRRLCLGFVVHTRRYKQKGRPARGSKPPINTPEKKQLCLSPCELGRSAFSYSFQHRLLPCHTLSSFIACSLLTFHSVHHLFINLTETVRRESFAMFSHLSPQSFTSLPLSCSSSVAGDFYNPTDPRRWCKIKQKTQGARNTRATLNIWAPFLASGQNSFHLWSFRGFGAAALSCNTSHLKTLQKGEYVCCNIPVELGATVVVLCFLKLKNTCRGRKAV